MTALQTLGILSTSFTWNAFPTFLKEFPHMLSACWLLFLHSAGPTHAKPSQLGWGRVIVEARSSDAAPHHSLSWSNNPYTANVEHKNKPWMSRCTVHASVCRKGWTVWAVWVWVCVCKLVEEVTMLLEKTDANCSAWGWVSEMRWWSLGHVL